MLKVDCHPEGGMALDGDFYVDYGPARNHEIHLLLVGQGRQPRSRPVAVLQRTRGAAMPQGLSDDQGL